MRNYIIAIIIGVLFVASLYSYGYYRMENTYLYYSGRVIETNQDLKRIEVCIDDKGPRVYVDNFGTYKYKDIVYGDWVDLELHKKQFKVIKIGKKERVD